MTKPDFDPHFRSSPLTDPWEPLYSKVTRDAVIIGLEAAPQHCNSRGFVHGGLISSIADNAMGLSCAQFHDRISGLITISLHLDFVSPARIGQWIEFQTTTTKLGKSIDMAQGQVNADGKLCAFMSATFKSVSRTETIGR